MDLQCPARLYVAWPASAADVAAYEAALREENVAATVDQRGGPVDLAGVADLYRGEAVLVLVDSAPPALPALGEGQVVACEVDSEGVRRGPAPTPATDATGSSR